MDTQLFVCLLFVLKHANFKQAMESNFPEQLYDFMTSQLGEPFLLLEIIDITFVWSMHDIIFKLSQSIAY